MPHASADGAAELQYEHEECITQAVGLLIMWPLLVTLTAVSSYCILHKANQCVDAVRTTFYLQSPSDTRRFSVGSDALGAVSCHGRCQQAMLCSLWHRLSGHWLLAPVGGDGGR